MDIRMEVHKIVLASISFNNLSKESFLSFTFNKCLYFSLKRSAGKCQIKSDNILVFSALPASQPGYQSVWRYWEEARAD